MSASRDGFIDGSLLMVLLTSLIFSPYPLRCVCLSSSAGRHGGGDRKRRGSPSTIGITRQSFPLSRVYDLLVYTSYLLPFLLFVIFKHSRFPVGPAASDKCHAPSDLHIYTSDLPIILQFHRDVKKITPLLLRESRKREREKEGDNMI